MTAPSTRRLLKESTDLHKNPSPYFTAAPTSDENLHDWHFTLAGPPSPTPYATGLYHGRITFPSTYPLRPPSFRFLTPSGRFEVNREICLSISGHHEETWQPAWGVRTALLAIRSEIMGAESQGQVGGMEVGEGVRREYARLSREWTCRECGESNGQIMNGLWEDCLARGVEVDVEGFQKSEDASAEGQSKTDGTGEGGHARDEAIPSPAPASTSAPHVAPPSAPAADSRPVPRSVPAATSTSTTTPTTTSASSTSTEPANSVWLDRAIIGVFIALVILILRRVTDVDDL